MKPIRVLVVDDSAFSRVSIGKMLQTDQEIQVLGYAANGEEGLRKVLELKPDVLTMDLEMPRMGGFGLLRLIMQQAPLPVIVVSGQSERQDVFKALELGAVDFIAKPARSRSSDLYAIEQDLTLKVRQAAQLSRDKLLIRLAAPKTAARLNGEELTADTVRHRSTVLLIGASTGGPPALHSMLSSLRKPLPVPIAVVQHMPPGFTKSFAQRLNDSSVLEVREAADGDQMLPGRVLICPGSKNMELQHYGGMVRVRIVDPPAGQIYTPSADVLFRTGAYIYGSRSLAVVLTGMGNDGASGVREVANYGGRVLAESEESSVVFGMPKEALLTGCVEKSIPIGRMMQEIELYCRP